jgi:hypothetical protein
MLKKTTHTTLSLLLAPILALISLQATAAADYGWEGQFISRAFPVEQISSYTTIIEQGGDEADVYYPTPRNGWNWMYVDSFPLVIMSQGAKVDKEYYSTLASNVASQGFVVVVPNQTSTMFGDLLRYAEMATIHEVMDHMRNERNEPSSPVYGMVDTSRLGLMGHSFGGASTIFATANQCVPPFCDQNIGFERPTELKATVLTSSNAGTVDVDTTGIPVAIISGTFEVGRTNQLITYGNLEAPKALFSVEGANHYGVCDADVPPGASAKEGEPAQAMPNAISAARYGYWAGLFLRAHVLDDQQAAWRIYSNVGTKGVTVESQW